MRYKFGDIEGELTPMFMENWYQYSFARSRNSSNIYFLIRDFFSFNSELNQILQYSFAMKETRVGSSFYRVEIALVPHASLIVSRIDEYPVEVPRDIAPYIWSLFNSYHITFLRTIISHLSHLSIVEDMFTNIIMIQTSKLFEENAFLACRFTDYREIYGKPLALLARLADNAQRERVEGH